MQAHEKGVSFPRAVQKTEAPHADLQFEPQQVAFTPPTCLDALPSDWLIVYLCSPAIQKITS